jgi:hypothetical protein
MRVGQILDPEHCARGTALLERIVATWAVNHDDAVG